MQIQTAKGMFVDVEGVSSGLIHFRSGPLFAKNTFGPNPAIDLARLSTMEIEMEFLGQTKILEEDTKMTFKSPTPTSSVVVCYTDNRPLHTKYVIKTLSDKKDTLKLGVVALGPSPTTSPSPAPTPSTSKILTAVPSMTRDPLC